MDFRLRAVPLNVSPTAAIPAIAVVICTHNRAKLLRRTLASVAAQTIPVAEREIVLVDDGSTDDTRAAAVEFAEHVTGFTAIHQANAGLGAARNAGWRATRAPIVAFLDDDAIAPPDWLESIRADFARGDARLGILGGPIDPEWESPPPPWLTRDLMGWLTVFDLGPAPLTSSTDPLFGGANMAFRTDALRAVNGFPINLGRKGASLLSHEEVAIWSAVSAHGWINAYDPALRVRHFTPSARMTIPWFRRRLYWEGISIARRQAWPKDMGTLLRVRRWTGMIFARFFSAKFLQPLLRPWRLAQDVKWQTYSAYYFGYLRELLGQMRGTDP